jgi:hypothetical protein
MENLQAVPRCNVEASEHSAQGFVTCTIGGVIIWRGSLAEIAASPLPACDAIYCHDDDVNQIDKMLSTASRSFVALAVAH